MGEKERDKRKWIDQREEGERRGEALREQRAKRMRIDQSAAA